MSNLATRVISAESTRCVLLKGPLKQCDINYLIIDWLFVVSCNVLVSEDPVIAAIIDDDSKRGPEAVSHDSKSHRLVTTRNNCFN